MDLNDVSSEALFEALLATPGDEMGFTVNRSGPQRGVRPDLTFSREALEGLQRHIMLWVGSRLSRHFQETGHPVHDLEVEVRVKTTASVLEPGVEPRLTVRFTDVLDAVHAQAARRGVREG